MTEVEQNNIGFKNAPAKVREIVFALRDGLQNTLRDKLIGLYLYGSLAYDCFNSEISDIDFVAVLYEPPTPKETQKLSQLHERLGCEPEYGKRIEGTYMTEEQVKTDNYPPDFLFYVDGKEFVKAKEGQGEQDFPMHRQQLHESGLRIIGYEPQKLFLPVPWEILKRSLQQEMPFIKEQFEIRPIYAVLNLCRVVRAYETHKLSSKKQGGEWGLQNFPAEFHEIIQTALEGYAHKQTDRQKQFLTENLSRFYEFCIERIANS
ncbi:MAG: DUF4111 domain-containing protein [Flavobacteriaceae bacterium]|nr:DUF4111 domain-containing protein [Flavobacteriaceae bacterium]